VAQKPLIFLVFLVGCASDAAYEGAFDVPVATAWLDPALGGPFHEPVGYVASGHGGEIGLIALTRGNEDAKNDIIGQGAFFTDNPTTLLDRGGPLATGAARSLTAIAPWTDGTNVDVYVGDAAFGTLLRVPHVGGDPAGLTHSEPLFTDADSSGDTASLSDLELADGYAATEDWTITFDGTEWLVHGTRSGVQPAATTGDDYETPGHALAFHIDGTATAGDHFDLHVDSGIEEIDVGGTPIALSLSHDGSSIAMIVTDDEGSSSVRWFDPVARAASEPVPLPDGSDPLRIAWSEAGDLFLADGQLPSAWEVSPSGDVVEHPLPWPIADIAVLSGESSRTAFVVPHDVADPALNRQIWRIDLADDTVLDADPWEAGEQGLDLRGPIAGIAAIPVSYERTDFRSGSKARTLRSVAASLTAGRVVFLEEDTGCLVPDAFGPRLDASGNLNEHDYTISFLDVAGTARLAENDGQPSGLDEHHVRVNPCAGVASVDTWTLQFDASLQGWTVKGGNAGLQAGIAYEDQRYVTDDGSLSFLIRSGSTPSESGWTMKFRVLEGALSATGDLDGDNTRGVNEGQIDIPGPPMFFDEIVDGTPRPWIAVPSGGDDVVGRIDPETGDLDIAWR
jgi:hypothetical protein